MRIYEDYVSNYIQPTISNLISQWHLVRENSSLTKMSLQMMVSRGEGPEYEIINDMFSGWWSIVPRIGLSEKLQETPANLGKKKLISGRFSLHPIQWTVTYSDRWLTSRSAVSTTAPVSWNNFVSSRELTMDLEKRLRNIKIVCQRPP